MRTKLFLLTFLSVFMALSFAYAAGTPSGTVISNYATGEYKDANGNAMASVTSNTVTTTVSQVGGVDIAAITSSSTASGGSTAYATTVTNTGNGSDTIDLSVVKVESGGGDNTVTIYLDDNGNGVLDQGETTVVSSTGALAADGTYDVIILVTNNSGADGSSVDVTFTGTSQFDSGVSDSTAFTSTVSASDLVVTISVDNNSPQPGDVVTVTITGQNNGSAAAEDVVFSGAIPTGMTYVPGSLKITTSARTDADDADSSDYNVTTAGSVTLNYGNIAASGSGYASFQVTLDAGVASGTTITPSASADFTGNGTPISGSGGVMTVSQTYAVTVGADDSDNADPSDVVVYAVTVTNSGNGSDSFNLTTSDDSSWTWTIYNDVNDNGAYDSGTDTVITNTGTLAQSAVLHVIVRATVPAGEEDAAVNAMTLTATSVGNGSESDNGVYTVTVTAPVLALTKTVSPTGSQPPGTELTYTVSISNSGTGAATTVVITDAVPTNTTYVAGSMTLGGASKTDASDADGATLSGNSAVFEISSLSAGGSETVTFKVTIN
jgi:trimeric autotransporter adhesin